MAAGLYLFISRTRAGMWVRAGSVNRRHGAGHGRQCRADVHARCLPLGAGLAALAGALLGPLLAVQVGMGENILILAFVVIVVGGIGSVRGALWRRLLVGIVDTAGRSLLPCAASDVAPGGGVQRRTGACLDPDLRFDGYRVIRRPQGLFAARS